MEGIITALLSNDNAQRTQADNLYADEKKKNPTGTFEALLNYLVSAQDTSHRSMTLVLLRRLLMQTDDLYRNLTVSTRAKTKEVLLQQLESDSNLSVRKKIAQLIAALAKATKEVQGDGWTDLTAKLTALISKDSKLDKISGLNTLNYLAEFDSERVVPFSKDFCVIVAPIMANNGDLETRIASLRAVCSLLQAKEQIESEFEELIPGMMAVVSVALEGKQEVVVQDAIKALLEVLESHPRFLKNSLSDLANFITTNITSKQDVEEETKSLSLELICSVAEKAQLELRKSPDVVETLIKVGMQVIASGCVLTTLEENNEENEEHFDDEEDFRLAGEDLITRVSKTVGNQIMLPLTFKNIELFLGEDSWQAKTSALRTIGIVSLKGGELFFEKIVQVIQMVTNFITNPTNERVTFTAIHCLATIFYSFLDLDEESKINCVTGGSVKVEDLEEEEEEKLLKNFYLTITNPVLKALSEALSLKEFSWKLKQEMCSTLLALFSTFDDKDIIKPFQEQLLSGLFEVIKNSPSNLFSVKVEGLTTVSSLAAVLQKEFGKYYDHFMPIAKDLIKFCVENSKQLPDNCEALRGKAMDCVGLLGAAVEKEKFEPDARYVLDLFIQSSKSASTGFYDINVIDDLDKNQESKEYIVRACCRITTTMGYESNFATYLTQLVEPLVKMAEEKIDISIFDSEFDDVKTDTQTNGVAKVDINVRGMGEKRVEINTWAVQDKELSLNMIFAYCDTFEEYFLPFAIKIYQVIYPELISPMYNVRMASTYVAPKVLNTIAKTYYLLNNQRTSFESTDGSGNLVSEQEFKQKQQKFAEFLKASSISESDLGQITPDLLNSIFDDLLIGLLEGVEYSIEEEEDFIQDEMDLFEEEEEDEMFIVAAESIASMLRLSFESGGMSDNTIDKVLDKNYNHSVHKPIFFIKPEKLKKVLTQMISIMRKRVEKRLRMVNVIKSMGENVDAQLVQFLESSDKKMNEFLDSMSEAVGCILKAHSALDTQFLLKVFHEVCHPFAADLLKHPESFEVVSQLKAVALFFYDDLFEFVGSAADEYLPFIVPHMVTLSTHSNYLVRQAACFGLGVLAENCGDGFNAYVPQIFAKLQDVINGPKAQKGSHTSATDNAISSLYKLILHRQPILAAQNVDVMSIFEGLLTLLPLKTDLIEAKSMHLFLVQHLQANDEIGQRFGVRIKEILAKAAKSQKGFDKERQKYNTHSSVITLGCRAYLAQQGIV